MNDIIDKPAHMTDSLFLIVRNLEKDISFLILNITVIGIDACCCYRMLLRKEKDAIFFQEPVAV